jgi:excisionase family DNA binding protein
MNLITTEQASNQLNLASSTIRKWARSGKLPGIKIGDDWRFPEDLTFSIDGHILADMGRMKKDYKGPKYLIRRPDSPFWYIKWKNIFKSTETNNVVQAQMLLAQEQQRYWAKQILQNDESHSILFSTLIAGYLKEVSPTKAQSGKSDFTNARKPIEFFGNDPIETITPQRCYQYQDWRKIQYVAPKKEGKEPTRLISGATINRELALVKNSLKYAVRKGYIAHSPTPKGEVEGMDEIDRDRYITDAEFDRIRENGTNRDFIDFIDSLYYSTLRFGKIASLRWKTINFEERMIPFINTVKNKKVPSFIYIHDRFLEILKRRFKERKTKDFISPYVFPGKNSQPIKSIKTSWKTACRRGGVEDARVHDLRHKAITDMRRAGIPIDQAMRAAGHLTAQMSERYTHWGIEQIKEAFEALK